jgi:hypothetical protein
VHGAEAQVAEPGLNLAHARGPEPFPSFRALSANQMPDWSGWDARFERWASSRGPGSEGVGLRMQICFR